MRLVDVEQVQQWDSRGHFFAAAAEAMRRILLESARGNRLKRGANLQRCDLSAVQLATEAAPAKLIAIDEALAQLRREPRRRRSWSS